MVVIDRVDKNILEVLTRNGRASAAQISRDLAKNNLLLTSRSVLNRINRLEKYGIIQGYTVRLYRNFAKRPVGRLILIKFVHYQNDSQHRKIDAYLNDASFCFFATRLYGEAQDFDYACYLVADTERQAEFQLASFLDAFQEIILKHHIYKSETIEKTSYPRATNHTKAALESLSPPDIPKFIAGDSIEEFLRVYMDDMVARLMNSCASNSTNNTKSEA
jgi:Lrp/AsnC family leucine-responsive transcriptional regulator